MVARTPPRRASTRIPVSAKPIEAPPIAPEPAPEPVPEPARGPRVPLGAHRLRLEGEERPGFKRRYLNDVGSRIEQARNAGYTFVNDPKTGEPKKQLVGVLKEGGGMYAYLMEIPIEFYNEDQDLKEGHLKQFDDAIKRGAGPGKLPGEDGRYVPMKPDGSPVIEIKDSIPRRQT